MLYGLGFLSIWLSNLSHSFSHGSSTGSPDGHDFKPFDSVGPSLRERRKEPEKLHLDFQQVNLNYHGIIKVNLDGLSLTGLPGLKSHEKNSDSDNESIQKFKSLEMPDFSWACLTRVVRAVRIRNWSNTDGQTERVSADKLLKSKY